MDRPGNVAGLYSGVSMDRGVARRTPVGAHDSFFCFVDAAVLSDCACGDGGDVGILAARAQYDHRNTAKFRGGAMKPITRRKLIYGGVAAAAGVGGLAAADRMAKRYGLIPPDRSEEHTSELQSHV